VTFTHLRSNNRLARPWFGFIQNEF